MHVRAEAVDGDRRTGQRGRGRTARESDGGAPVSEMLDLPTPEGIGPLVPWMPASAWQGKGIPPKQFSLFGGTPPPIQRST